MRVADYIAKRIVKAGISNVFLVTGGGAMHLNDAFGRNKDLDITCFHHEQAAAIAAEGYARKKGVACALNVTSGPGGLNALVGVHGAYVDSIPMFVVSGQVKLETLVSSYPNVPLRQLGDQEVDIISIVRPIVKYVTIIKEPSEIIAVMDEALFLMSSGRPGPVWIDIPVDIQSAFVSDDCIETNLDQRVNRLQLLQSDACTPNTILELTRAASHNENIDLYRMVFERLKTAKRPVILVGTGVTGTEVKALFSKWIDTLDIPVVPGWNALDIIPNEHKNYAGRPGTVGDRPGNFAVQNADLIIVIGCRLNIRQVSYNWKSFAKNAYKVMIDIDKAELEKPTLDIDLKICSTAKDFLIFALSHPFVSNDHQVYLDWCREKLEKYPVVLDSYKNTPALNPYYFLSEFSKQMPEDETIVTGNGSACVMSFQAFNVKRGQRIFTNSGCASMGYELPAAIGACIASDKQKVFCIAGDGSIMMNLQELQTIFNYRFPIKILLLNNNGYLSIKLTQSAYFKDNIFGTGPENGVGLPNFQKIAQGFDIPYGAINKITDLHSDYIQGLMCNSNPAFIEVFVDPEQGFLPKLASRKNEDGSMTSPALEDMAPFLSREELASNMLQ